MEYVKLKSTFRTAHEFRKAEKLFSIDRNIVKACFIDLVLWAADNREDGNLHGLDDAAIDEICEWSYGPPSMLEVLKGSGLVVHDEYRTLITYWKKFAGDYLAKVKRLPQVWAEDLLQGLRLKNTTDQRNGKYPKQNNGLRDEKYRHNRVEKSRLNREDKYTCTEPRTHPFGDAVSEHEVSPQKKEKEDPHTGPSCSYSLPVDAGRPTLRAGDSSSHVDALSSSADSTDGQLDPLPDTVADDTCYASLGDASLDSTCLKAVQTNEDGSQSTIDIELIPAPRVMSSDASETILEASYQMSVAPARGSANDSQSRDSRAVAMNTLLARQGCTGGQGGDEEVCVDLEVSTHRGIDAVEEGGRRPCTSDNLPLKASETLSLTLADKAMVKRKTKTKDQKDLVARKNEVVDLVVTKNAQMTHCLTRDASRDLSLVGIEPVAVTCRGGKDTYLLTVDQINQWRAAYPSVDVCGELRKAIAWHEANTSKRKTLKGMTRFFTPWSSRCEDKAASRAAYQQAPRLTRKEQLIKETDDALFATVASEKVKWSN